MILYPQIPFEYSTIAIVVNGLQKLLSTNTKLVAFTIHWDGPMRDSSNKTNLYC